MVSFPHSFIFITMIAHNKAALNPMHEVTRVGTHLHLDHEQSFQRKMDDDMYDSVWRSAAFSIGHLAKVGGASPRVKWYNQGAD